MIFELDQKGAGDWDTFQVRKIGFRVQGRPFESLESLIPDLSRWSTEEKQLLGEIIKAKKEPEEIKYLNLMRRHDRLRAAIIKLGS
jgi:hypothetical protein